MRKVDLSMEENKKYETIKKLVDTTGNKTRASIELGCTVRQINRMIIGYKENGKAFFIHGNKNRTPSNTLDDNSRQLILDFYRTKYAGANLTHFSELLLKHEDIKVSPGCIRNILLQNHILSPKARKTTKKKLKAHLEDLQGKSPTLKEATEIFDAIIAIEDAHPRRPRCAYTGEMLQMDASLHDWFGPNKSQLHIAVDDASGEIVGAYFDAQETLKGYYNVLDQVLTNYGIPYMFFTDRRTVFEYKKKNTSSIEEDTFTQFSYACNQLGIEIKTSSIAQAKGRVERMFQTLQSRLPLELRLAGATTLEQANEFLNSYIKEFNAQFALPFHSIKTVFEKQPDKEKINLTLAILTNRKVDNGHCIRFNKTYYRPIDCNGYPVNYRKGTSGIVIKAFDNNMFLCIEEKIYALDAVPDHELTSKNFDITPVKEKPKKRYIPPMSHPWKQASFERHLRNQAHRQDNIA
jgi:hypothetical protein